MRFLLNVSLVFVFSSYSKASIDVAKNAYSRLEWFSEKPLESSFVEIYGYTAARNPELKKKLEISKFARVINVYDHVQAEKNIEFHPNRVLRGHHLGVPIEISRRTNVHDRRLIDIAIKDKSKPAREVLEFRVHTLNKSMVVFRHIGGPTEIKFPLAKATARLATQVTALEMQGINVVRIEVIHNHPVQAVEFYDEKKRPIGYFYNSFSRQDLQLGKAMQEAFPFVPVEVAILIGLQKENLFRVSYFPGRIQTAKAE